LISNPAHPVEPPRIIFRFITRTCALRLALELTDND